MNTKLTKFINENSPLFWWIKEGEKKNISTELLVEAILNYGNERSVKKLFALVGIRQVAAIFRRQIAGPRKNYHPRTINYFNLYFQKNAS